MVANSHTGLSHGHPANWAQDCGSHAQNLSRLAAKLRDCQEQISTLAATLRKLAE